MKIYHSSENFASLKTLILQLQLSLEFSQINEILSTYNEALLFLTEYSFLFETFFKETPSLKNTHTNFKSPFSSPDPARDGWNWWGYCAGNPVMNVDFDGHAPRNLSEKQRQKYKESITSVDVSKAPANVVCSSYAAYLASNAMESATGEKQYYKNLQHDGKKLSSYHGIYAEDYSSTKDGSANLSFYADTNGNKDNNFNSVNIEEGTIGVFGTKNPLKTDEEGNTTGWTGHIITVTNVQRDDNGNVTSISFVQGHSKGKRPDKENNCDVVTFQQYINGTGPFIGWGEIGPNSAMVYDISKNQTEVKTNEERSK